VLKAPTATLARVFSVKLKPSSFRVRKVHDAGTDVRYELSAASAVAVEVEQKVGRRYVKVPGTKTIRGTSGGNAFHFSGRRLKAGSYLLVLTPVSSDGFRGQAKTARFRVIG
jgi:hypothetical protein